MDSVVREDSEPSFGCCATSYLRKPRKDGQCERLLVSKSGAGAEKGRVDESSKGAVLILMSERTSAAKL